MTNTQNDGSRRRNRLDISTCRCACDRTPVDNVLVDNLFIDRTPSMGQDCVRWEIRPNEGFQLKSSRVEESHLAFFG